MLELLSIHIAKTGGMSFESVLRTVYGTENVLRIGRDDAEQTLKRLHRQGVENMPRVLHGHFTYKEVAKIHRETGVPLITWLRDPVERAISNYFFFIKETRKKPNHPQAHRRDENLLDWAKRQDTRNKMAKFLDGIKLEELFFFGLMESFADDLEELGKRLGWPKVELVHVNSNKAFRSQFTPIPPENRELIKKWNNADFDLYREACRLRSGIKECKTTTPIWLWWHRRRTQS